MNWISIFRFFRASHKGTLAVLIAAFLFCSSSAFAASADTAPSADLYSGWLKMYDLKFDEAHQVFGQWKQDHASDSLGHVSDAAAWLFSELARLGILESEFFTDDSRFLHRAKPLPDPEMKTQFRREIERAEQLADAALRDSPRDTNALFAKSLTFGLRADFFSLIEKQDMTALKFTKEGRIYADKLTAVDPKAYDAYLGTGLENYLLSLKPAPLRAFLWLTGAQVNREKGLQELRITAQRGHYLEPFAKLLLAVADLRDNNRAGAQELLAGLHLRFPDNGLYLQELNRISSPAGNAPSR
ncbi:MAG TPA: hypothetical protein VG273_21190 [Bryobacteraceae bacterium]|jgi:hypothetical protein|nr:hypothetical protein [Bryobacteraceae bacterium]